MESTSYTVVFFDTALPALPQNQNLKRINYSQWQNLVDEAIPGKTVQLTCNQVTQEYKIINYRIVHVKNLVDNTLFLICDVEKI